MLEKLKKNWLPLLLFMVSLIGFIAGMIYFSSSKFEKQNDSKLLTDSIEVEITKNPGLDSVSFVDFDRRNDSLAAIIDKPNNISLPIFQTRNCDDEMTKLKKQLLTECQAAKDSLIKDKKEMSEKVKNLENYIKLQDKQIERLSRK